jgi:hypothetical protein
MPEMKHVRVGNRSIESLLRSRGELISTLISVETLADESLLMVSIGVVSKSCSLIELAVGSGNWNVSSYEYILRYILQ